MLVVVIWYLFTGMVPTAFFFFAVKRTGKQQAVCPFIHTRSHFTQAGLQVSTTIKPHGSYFNPRRRRGGTHLVQAAKGGMVKDSDFIRFFKSMTLVTVSALHMGIYIKVVCGNRQVN